MTFRHTDTFRVPFPDAILRDRRTTEPTARLDVTADMLRTSSALWSRLATAAWVPASASASASASRGGFSLALEVLVSSNGTIYTGNNAALRPSHTRAVANVFVREGVRLLQTSANIPTGTAMHLMHVLIQKTHHHNSHILHAIITAAGGGEADASSVEAGTGGGAGAGAGTGTGTVLPQCPPLVVRVSVRSLTTITYVPEADRLQFSVTHANAMVVYPRCVVLVEPTLLYPIAGLVTLLRKVCKCTIMVAVAQPHSLTADLPLCTVTAAVVVLCILANVRDPAALPPATCAALLQAVSKWAHEQMHWFLRLLIAASSEP